MLIAWGAMPESTTGAKSRLVHAGAMPMRWGAATQRGRGAMPIEAGIAHIGCIPNFSTPVFDFFLVWPYKNRVFSFFSFFSSFWAYRPAAVLQLERAVVRSGGPLRRIYSSLDILGILGLSRRILGGIDLSNEFLGVYNCFGEPCLVDRRNEPRSLEYIVSSAIPWGNAKNKTLYTPRIWAHSSDQPSMVHQNNCILRGIRSKNRFLQGFFGLFQGSKDFDLQGFVFSAA